MIKHRKIVAKPGVTEQYRACDLCETALQQHDRRCRFCNKDLCAKHSYHFEYGPHDTDYWIYCEDCLPIGKFVHHTVTDIKDALAEHLDSFEEKIIAQVKDIIISHDKKDS